MLSVAGVRLLLRPARTSASPSRDLQPHPDVRRHVRRGGRHQPPDPAHPRPGRTRAGSRAANGEPLRGQPRARARALARAPALGGGDGTCARSSRVKVAVLLPGPDGALEAVLAEEGTLSADDKDLGVAEWVWLHQKPAGAGTDTLPSARALFVPLKGSRGRVGVLALYPSAQARLRRSGRARSCSTRSRASSARPSSARSSPRKRAARPAARWRPSSSATRSSAPSRTTCARRSPSSPGATSALLDEHGPKDEAVRRELLADGPRGGPAPQPPRAEPARHDSPRGRGAEGPQGAAAHRGGRRRGARSHGGPAARTRDRTRASPTTCRWCPSIAALIEQVLINLLENADEVHAAGQPDRRPRARPGRRRRGGGRRPGARRAPSGCRACLRQVLPRARGRGRRRGARV